MTATTPAPTAAENARPPQRRGSTAGEALNLAALTLFKLADGLINPKLVLSWLLSALGAPAGVVGALVPVREAGALLPQLALAPRIRAARQRKRFWALGAALQGVAALGIGLAALTLEGLAAGLVILALLALLAVARAVCSVSHKDMLARTVAEDRRGRITGRAASLGAAAVLVFGGLLASGILPLTPTAIAGAALVAGLAWLGAAATALALNEPADAPRGGGRTHGLRELIAPLRSDRQLGRFVLARALLTPTAFALPFLVMLSHTGDGGTGLGSLGPLVIAAGIASIASGWIWGHLADRSSRKALALGGALAAIALAAAAATGAPTGGLGGIAGAVLAVAAAQTGYEGVRTGRKIYLTNMADDDRRALYTALSNTAIGAVLLLGGGLGLVADLAGLPVLLGLLSAVTAGGAALAWTLPEAEGRA
ncbi:hypothetical protein LNKW23_24240 [Paralimibaculum aggregatum]|uniref:MFS transporter n=1 Tax=Paralimibaculum aggregatum TaxID=3036245 RepID=A0ABQ6LQT3_9RHOB|nr:MFS transporter [Limibaculum sp. NKW23]GMG83211.1 hypothetical protein LNKW23_24240 [Limibaculum sp. NKW23]